MVGVVLMEVVVVQVVDVVVMEAVVVEVVGVVLGEGGLWGGLGLGGSDLFSQDSRLSGINLSV